jgi:ribonucleotide reductase alpha subunit
MFSFEIDGKFVDTYRPLKEPFGFNGLGSLVYHRTYSRVKSDGSMETWVDTCQRVINGMYTILKDHAIDNRREWSDAKAQRSAQDAFDRLFDLKWTPPGRGLWMMGTPFVHERKTPEALMNCAFVSTKKLSENPGEPFAWAMEKLMLGVGVGFDTNGAKSVTIRATQSNIGMLPKKFVIPDSREGWVDSVKRLINYYLFKGSLEPEFDYSQIRVRGTAITGFGGVASGPEPLIELHNGIRSVFSKSAGKTLSARHIVDAMNMIGKCVVAGNVRRSAEIALGDIDDSEFLSLKDYTANPERESFGWASNNTVMAAIGSSYKKIVDLIFKNGEPGIVWIDNARLYGRMNGQVAPFDAVEGVNPCQPGFATVLTPSGIKTFDEIDAGSKIWGKNGWTTVLRKWSTGEKDVYNYSSSFGQFVGTSNHRVVQDGQKVEAQYATKIDASRGPISNEKPNTQSVLDGLLIGDGSVHKDSGDLVYLLIGENDKDYYKSEIAQYLLDDRSVGLSSSPSAEAYTVHSEITADELPRTYLRTIPKRYFASEDKRVITGFLRGLFSANGTVVDNGRRVVLKQTSKELIRQAQLMLSSVGIRSFITINKPTSIEWQNGTHVSKESYGLCITRDRDVFLETIGFIQEYKNQKITTSTRSGQCSGVVQDVEFVGTMEVYDITVDNDDHVYWTGGLLVSNCGEQFLESHELCTLVELYPNRATDLYDYLRTIKYAYLYGKAATLMSHHISDDKSREVMMRNRRIGTSNAGVSQFIAKHGTNTMREWFDAGYDEIQRYDKVYSMWLNVPKSIRTTTSKPGGTVPLLAGATPGIHFPHSEYYIRRIRISSDSALWSQYKDQGYHVESDVVSPNTMIISFPIHAGEGVVAESDVTIWQQLAITAMTQRYWSDNGVSVTIKFDPEKTTKSEMEAAIELYEDQLKAVSFLPSHDGGAYPQMPYETISKAQYDAMMKRISEFSANVSSIDKMEDKYCDGEACAIF